MLKKDFLESQLDDLSSGNEEVGREILEVGLGLAGESAGELLEGLDLSHLRDQEGERSFGILVPDKDEWFLKLRIPDTWIHLVVKRNPEHESDLSFEELISQCGSEEEEGRIKLIVPIQLWVVDCSAVGADDQELESVVDIRYVESLSTKTGKLESDIKEEAARQKNPIS